MVFSSPIFLFFFLPLVFLLHCAIKDTRTRNVLLAAASLVFYAFGQLFYVPLFLLSIVINYVSGVILMREKYRKLALTVSVVLNIGILCVFKYTDFLISNINAAAGTNFPLSGIILPIGISFFTFQGLSYVIDVYRDPKSGTKNFLKLFLYISFFPQLIAGPIVKYHDIAEQIDNRVLEREGIEAGVRRFCVGVAKKVLIANAVGSVADKVFIDRLGAYGSAMDWRIAWIGAICYMLQIYYDFSGYSDMAIGMGRMFGFRFLENFNHPYAAVSIQDFWRRWHISLSSWFKEYLYIPLGGNRRGKLRTAFNKLIVFFCTGIWHGANWTFLFWGLGHGLLASLEGAGIIPAKRLSQSRAGRYLCRIYTLLSVTLLFVVFRADSIRDGFAVISAMFSGHTAADGAYMIASMLPAATVFVLILAILFAGDCFPRVKRNLSDLGLPVHIRETIEKACAIVLYVLSILSLSRGGFNPFIYFQF